MRDAGEAIMNKFATNEARKLSRIGSLAIISGAMLGAVGPALSADLPEDYPPYRPTYYRNYCYSCERRFERPVVEERVLERPVVEERVVQRPVVEERVVERPFVEERVVQRPFVEERVVQRPYIERQYPPYAATTRYAYSSYSGPYRCPARCAESYPTYEPAPYREPRQRLSYVGAHYPPAPEVYEYESEPRAPYRYAASSYRPYDYYRPSYEPEYNPAYRYKPAYEYEPSPRPPAVVPEGYYRRGYFK
jgi:hypothetical protein